MRGVGGGRAGDVAAVGPGGQDAAGLGVGSRGNRDGSDRRAQGDDGGCDGLHFVCGR